MPTNRLLPIVRILLMLFPAVTVVAQPDTARTQFRVAPRIQVGNDWETLIVLLNKGAMPVSFQQAFFSDQKPANISVRSEALGVKLTAAAIQGVVAPGAKVTLLVGSPSDNVKDLWSLLSFGEGALDGYVIVRRRATGGAFSFEATFPLTGTQDVSTYMPFDDTNGFRSQLTIVNPASDISAHVRLTYLDSTGGTILIDVIPLDPGEQFTCVLPDAYPDLANKSGTILIEADTDRLAVAGLRENAAYGVIAALPSLPRPASR